MRNGSAKPNASGPEEEEEELDPAGAQLQAQLDNMTPVVEKLDRVCAHLHPGDATSSADKTRYANGPAMFSSPGIRSAASRKRSSQMRSSMESSRWCFGAHSAELAYLNWRERIWTSRAR